MNSIKNKLQLKNSFFAVMNEAVNYHLLGRLFSRLCTQLDFNIDHYDDLNKE
jgi:hypothetical protein